jgi:hypothetical protein
MKNVYVLPHSEIGFDPKKSTNIYITTNEKPKLNDWVLDILDNVMFRVTEEDILTTELDGLPFNFKKIILTTDEELIKEGVQAIDDEFLEWFAKNPSCEEVEVEESTLLNTSRTYLGVDKYKIIIPKEEPKNIYKGVLNNITFGENEMYYVNIPELGNIPVNYQVEINLGEKYLQTLLGKPLNWRVTEFDYTHKRPEGRYRVIGLE